MVKGDRVAVKVGVTEQSIGVYIIDSHITEYTSNKISMSSFVIFIRKLAL